MKALHDFSPPRNVTSADAIGRLFVQDFLRPSNSSVQGLTVPLYDVVHQQDPVFLATVAKIQTGKVDDDAISFFRSRFMENLSPAKCSIF
jgi:hypothetical protein